MASHYKDRKVNTGHLLLVWATLNFHDSCCLKYKISHCLILIVLINYHLSVITMAESQELPQDVNGLETEIGKPPENQPTDEKWEKCSVPFHSKHKWWIQVVVYSFFVLAGLATGNLLGRVYFEKGGNSIWMATLVQVVGFPVLFPFQWFQKPKKPPQIDHETNKKRQPSPTSLAAVYVGIGIFLAAVCMLLSIGLQNLPVITFTLICASQLGFNALFSYFLNGEKLTPYIINSIVLLTISSILLVFQPDSSDDAGDEHKQKYVAGFICTLVASAGYGLLLSLTQLAFKKVIKEETLKTVVDMTIYQCLVASLVIVIGLFASGDSGKLSKEMDEYESGRVSYVINLVWTSISWAAFALGCTGLIFKVSALFSNVISILAVPLGPVLAVIFLHEKLTGLKAMSMVLAVWGIASYIYQFYLDDLKMKEDKRAHVDSKDVALLVVEV